MCIRVEMHVQIEQSVKCCSIKLHLKNQKNALNGTVRVPHGLISSCKENEQLTVERIKVKAKFNWQHNDSKLQFEIY